MHFEIENPTPLVDDPINFRVTGIPPGHEVRVGASWELSGVQCESLGCFAADSDGVVSPGNQASLGGTYRGVEPFGLWWSAKYEGEFGPSNLVPIVVTLSATGEMERSDARIVRRRVDPNITVSRVDDDGLVGVYFRPGDDATHSAVMVVGGSGGGFNGADATAALLASRGIASLALAYFGLPGLPAGLVEIPLEYFESGLRWLAARPEVGGRVGVVGQSRGGELALLLGATFSQVGAVVARVPSSVVWDSIGPGSGPDVAAWTFEGNAVPWMSSDEDSPAWVEVYKSRPLVCTPGSLADLSDVEAVRAAQIEVERATCPILLISGEDDALWPSTTMAEQVERRAREHGFAHGLTHLRYPDAGHFCAVPPGLPSPVIVTHPADHERIALGGTLQGNAAAQADSWSKTLDFLRDALASEKMAKNLA